MCAFCGGPAGSKVLLRPEPACSWAEPAWWAKASTVPKAWNQWKEPTASKVRQASTSRSVQGFGPCRRGSVCQKTRQAPVRRRRDGARAFFLFKAGANQVPSTTSAATKRMAVRPWATQTAGLFTPSSSCWPCQDLWVHQTLSNGGLTLNAILRNLQNVHFKVPKFYLGEMAVPSAG